MIYPIKLASFRCCLLKAHLRGLFEIGCIERTCGRLYGIISNMQLTASPWKPHWTRGRPDATLNNVKTLEYASALRT